MKKKLFIFVLITVMFLIVAGFATGSSAQINNPVAKHASQYAHSQRSNHRARH